MSWKVFFIEECASTMDEAKALEARGESGVFALVCARQSAGRGRQGSAWTQAGGSAEPAPAAQQDDPAPGAKGGGCPVTHQAVRTESLFEAMRGARDALPFTLCIPAAQLKVPLGWIPALVGVALVEALEEARLRIAAFSRSAPGTASDGGPLFRIKWPNDIVFRSEDGLRKVAGILCESTLVGSDAKSVCIGIGLNFLSAPDGVPQAASAAQAAYADLSGRPRAKLEQALAKDAGLREMLLRDLLERLERELSELLLVPRGVAQIRDLVVSRSLPVGTVLSVNKGEHRGEFAGLAEDGGLLLAHLDKAIHAGAVEVLDPTLPPAERAKPEVSSTPAPDSARMDGAKPPKAQTRVLALDIGNTRLHYGLRLRGENEAECGDLDLAALEGESAKLKSSLAPLLRDLREERQATLIIRLASVRSTLETNRALERLEAFLKTIFPELRVRRENLSSAEILKGSLLQSPYPLDQLGPDRALRFRLAAARAKLLGRPVAWASAGTALTLEAVGPQGEILESWIGPGLNMALEALHQGTAKLPQVSTAEISTETGPGTRRSMLDGATAQALGALLLAYQRLDLAELHLTGGDAPTLIEAAMRDPNARTFNLVLASHDELRALLDLKVEAAAHADPLGGLRPRGEQQGRQPANAYGPVDAASPAGTRIDEVLSSSSEHAARIIRSMRRGRLTARAEPLSEPSRDEFRRLGPRIEENNGAGERLDGFLAHKFRFHARSEWRERILNREVLLQHGAPKEAVHEMPLNALPVKPDAKLALYDQLWLYQPASHEPEQMTDLEVVGDDGDLVAFSKPPNLVVHAAGLYGQNTFLSAAKRMGYADAAPVHRIDRETSGLLLCGRSSKGRDAVSRSFRDGLMEKMYIAICKGTRELPRRFQVRLPIGPALQSRIRLKLWVDHPDAVPARTDFEVLARAGEHILLACVPKTGRTNQIRVHLAAIGIPILGDKMYHPNEDVFLAYYDHGLTPEVLEQAVWARHLLHNTALRGPPGSPKLVEEALVCPIAGDFFDFAPAKEMLLTAGLVEERDAQKAILRALFERMHASGYVEGETIA